MVAKSKTIRIPLPGPPVPIEQQTFIGCCLKMPDSTPGIIRRVAFEWKPQVRGTTQDAQSLHIEARMLQGKTDLPWPGAKQTMRQDLTGKLVFFKLRLNGKMEYQVDNNYAVTEMPGGADIGDQLTRHPRGFTVPAQPQVQAKDVDALRERLNQVQRELSQKEQSLANIEKSIQDRQRYKNQLEGDTGKIEDRYTLGNQKLQAAESRIKEVTHRLAALQAEVKQAETRVGDARTRVAEWTPVEDTVAALQALRENLATLQEQENGLLASIQAGEEAIQANQVTLSRLEGLLGEGRQRLWDDIQTVQEVLEVGGRTSKARPAPKGREFQDEAHFFSKRLEPALATWLPKASTKDAEFLHLALLGCRGVLVPGAIWTKAYAEALGASCCFSMTAVGATWIDPQKADGVLAETFQAARQNPHHIFLHHFRGIDRAPMQCWAGGLLDALAGLHDFEPGSDGVGWPENLRITLSLDADDLSLPVPAGLLQGFGAVPREGLPGTPCVPLGLEEDAFLAARTWIDWTTAPRTADPVPPRDLGPWTRQGNREIQTLVDVATVLEHPPRLAELIRLEWPKNYASEGVEILGLGPSNKNPGARTDAERRP